MPGNVQLATALGVLPKNLCSAYSRQRHLETRFNLLTDGSHIRGPMVGTDQSFWGLAQKLSGAAMNSLRGFYLVHNGPEIPFFFYDFYESGFHYDQTGALGLGRYVVRFQGDFSVTGGLARSGIQFTLVQIA